MRKYTAWGAAIVVLAAVAALVVALPAQVSYCRLCGAQAQTRDLGLRFTALTFQRPRKTVATDFSRLLHEKQLITGHAHEWQSPRLVPDPLNEYGPPVLESLEFLNAPRVVNFMRNVADYADPESSAKWKDLVLQPEYARVLDSSLRFLHVPAAGFPDRTEFLIWWGRNSFAVYNRLREVTETD